MLSKYDIFTVGETPMVDPRIAAEITNEQTGSLNMVFQFEHMGSGYGSRRRLKWEYVSPGNCWTLKKVMTRWQKGLENQGWNSLYLIQP